jgi:hypothetical protein
MITRGFGINYLDGGSGIDLINYSYLKSSGVFVFLNDSKAIITLKVDEDTLQGFEV